MEPEELRKIRKNLGFRNRALLSAELGVSPRTIESWEQGRRKIPDWVHNLLLFLLKEKMSN